MVQKSNLKNYFNKVYYFRNNKNTIEIKGIDKRNNNVLIALYDGKFLDTIETYYFFELLKYKEIKCK